MSLRNCQSDFRLNCASEELDLAELLWITQLFPFYLWPPLAPGRAHRGFSYPQDSAPLETFCPLLPLPRGARRSPLRPSISARTSRCRPPDCPSPLEGFYLSCVLRWLQAPYLLALRTSPWRGKRQILQSWRGSLTPF